jgi:hypothetical protein
MIIEPGTPKWVRPFIDPAELRGTTLVGTIALVLALIVGIILALAGPLAVTLAGSAVAAAVVALAVTGTVRATRRSVDPPNWLYKGMPIVGQARTALADAVSRARDVEQFVNEIPTRIDWKQFRPHIEAVLWDAANHAAQVCQLNEQLNKMRYAEPDTPQGDRYAELADRRLEHLAVVERARDDLKELAAAAGNAAAVARVALERSGTVHDLDVISPNAPTLIAQGGIEEAQTQLELLSEAWAEVEASESGVPVSARGRRGLRARRSPPPTGQQQEG